MSDANNRTNDQIESAVDHGDHERPDDEDRAEDTIVVAMAAGQLRQGAKDVELREAPTVPGTETILAWGYFNPFGPTANRIDVLPAADTGELLLIRASNHESSPDYRAIALIPPGVNQAAAIRDALTPIFAANGRRDEWVIVGGVPSYVHLIPESPVDHSCAAELFRSANATAGETWGTPPDYCQEIQDLLHAWRDPWGRAAEAVNRSLQGPAAQRLLAQIRQLEAVDSLALTDDDEAEDDQVDEAETDTLFDLWFALARQPEYVERIAGQMGIAWTGAQTFRAGAFSRAGGSVRRRRAPATTLSPPGRSVVHQRAGDPRNPTGTQPVSLHHPVFRPPEDYKPGQHCGLYSNLHKHSNRSKVVGEAERGLECPTEEARKVAFITWLVELGYLRDDPSVLPVRFSRCGRAASLRIGPCWRASWSLSAVDMGGG